MNSKVVARKRRARSGRMKMRELRVVRLTVHRTSQHIYAQLIAPDNRVIAVTSTLDKLVKNQVKCTGNIAAAKVVGQLIAAKAKEKGVDKVAFDRSGFKYHGRVKALADAAREGGINF